MRLKRIKLITIETIKTKLKVKEQHFDDRSCPAVKYLYDEFYGLNLTMMAAKDRTEQAKGVVTNHATPDGAHL